MAGGHSTCGRAKETRFPSGRRHMKKGGKRPCSGCGSVETCRNAAHPEADGREDAPCGGRASGARKNGDCSTEKHQESLPLRQRRAEEKEQEEGRGAGKEEGQPSDHGRGRCGGAGVQPGHRGQGVHRSGRAFRLRQVHHAAHGGGAGGDQRRRAGDRRQGGQRRGAEGPGYRHGVPELRAVPAHDGVREHGFLAEAAPHPQGHHRPEGAGGGGDVRRR